MITYNLTEYDGCTRDATHEISADFLPEDPHPPILPVGTVIDLCNGGQGMWIVVQIRYFADFDGPGRHGLSYLVKKWLR